MAILTLISFILIMLLLMSMFSKARPWTRLKLTGKVLQVVPMNFWQRTGYHRSTLLALATATVFGLAGGWLPPYLAGMIAIFTLAILLMPMKYTFTTKGVAIGEASFRTWDEFTGISTRRNRVEFQHPSYFGRLTLFVKTADVDSLFNKIFPKRYQSQSV